MIICKQCGASNVDNGMFCCNCGSVLESAGIPNYSDTQGYVNPQQDTNNSGVYTSVNNTGSQPYYTPDPSQPAQPTYQQQYQAPVQPQQPQYQPYSGGQPQQPYQQGYQQYNQQYYQPFGDQNFAQQQQLANSAKSLGIVALIFGFIIPFVTWITGSICIKRANQVSDYANSFGYQEIANTAKTAKTLATIGIIVSVINALITIALQSMPH